MSNLLTGSFQGCRNEESEPERERERGRERERENNDDQKDVKNDH